MKITGCVIGIILASLLAPPAAAKSSNKTSPDRKSISVLQYGAVCDGSADDTTAIQKAINIAQTNHLALIIPPTASTCKISDQLTISAPISITGGGSITQSMVGKKLFAGGANDISITNLKLVGSQHANYMDREAAIDIEGTFHAGMPPENISGLELSNLNISNFGGYAIKAKYVSHFKYDNNNISDIGFTGIEMLSGQNGSINGNIINDITSTGLPGGNAYGIIVSRDTYDRGNLTSQPNSSYVTVANNVIRNVPTWECYDTHSGQHITFANDIGYKCGIAAFHAGASKDSAGKYSYAPNDISMVNPVANSGVIDGSLGSCIMITGASPTALATASITGGTITNCGKATSLLGNAVLLYNTNAVKISGLSVIHPSPTAFLLDGENHGTIISGTKIMDPWTNAANVGKALAFYATNANNTVDITGNFVHHDSSFSAAYLLTTPSGAFYRSDPNPGNVLRLGANNTNAGRIVIRGHSKASPDGR